MLTSKVKLNEDVMRPFQRNTKFTWMGFILLTVILQSGLTAQNESDQKDMSDTKLESATFGAGCFWCIEALFQDLKGVHSVNSGYAGGHVNSPSYKEVCTGTTGHAEVAQIIFDPKQISFEDLLYVFWRTHDPTTLNRQGADVGSQYRSAIFYNSDEQKRIAEKSKAETEKSGLYENPIVTEIVPLTNYFEAEDYHQDYYNINPDQPYCRFVIDPKIQKFKKEFKEKLK
jgi:peptide-methionine (S)-S-oxide reductase